MIEKFAFFIGWISLAIDVFGLSILVLGFSRGALGWLQTEIKREPWEIRTTSIKRLRCIVGLHILFALELLIVSDIIDSFVAVTLSQPGSEDFFHSETFYTLVELGIIVMIRTVLDFFLSKELNSFEESATQS